MEYFWRNSRCLDSRWNTVSRVLDISSQSKQKLKSKRRSKIVKIYANLLSLMIFFVLTWWISNEFEKGESRSRSVSISANPYFSEFGSSQSLWDKALVNEDTLLPMMFLGLRKLGKICWETQNVSEQNQKHFFCAGHKIFVRNKCCARGQTGKHLCRQQCVRNNVSSFARAYKAI